MTRRAREDAQEDRRWLPPGSEGLRKPSRGLGDGIPGIKNSGADRVLVARGQDRDVGIRTFHRIDLGSPRIGSLQIAGALLSEPPVAGRRTNRSGRPCLTPDELIAEIERLYGSLDWKRLYRRACSRAFWAPRGERRSLAEDLRHEAVVKVLGSRPVPVGVKVIAALYQAVRSTAWTWRWKRRRLSSLETTTIRTTTGKRVPAKDVA